MLFLFGKLIILLHLVLPDINWIYKSDFMIYILIWK